MFAFYGAKKRLAIKYPTPIHDILIEPFAGSAQYSLLYSDRKVILMEKDDIIYRVWKWLQNCSPSDILSLPYVEYRSRITDYKWPCIEARWFMGFNIAAGSSSPRNTPSKWRTILRPGHQQFKKEEAAILIGKIRHWDIRHGSYEELEPLQATWFIDPPYIAKGDYYRCGSKDIDYSFLGEWCLSREGQVMVCESKGATWLPFKDFNISNGVKGQSTEVLWQNNYQKGFSKDEVNGIVSSRSQEGRTNENS